jgi:hypothetical protein
MPRVATALAGLLVLFALVAPNQLGQLNVAAFVRIPVEGLLLVGLVLLLPPKAQRVLVVIVGVILGLVTVMKIIDMSFYAAIARPFDPLADWGLFGPALDFLMRSIGRAAAIASVVGAVLLVTALIGLMTWSVRRLTRFVVSHRATAVRTVAILGSAWLVCLVFGVQIVPGVPVADESAAMLAYQQVRQVRADLRDRQAFAKQIADDAFHDTAGDRLLTALRGRDVVFTFVESYGRVAIEDQDIASGVDALLDAATIRLRAAGFASRSSFLTSPTAGGISWLPHATLQSGLWVDTRQRYGQLMTSGRRTLTSAFRRAGWRTVAVVPGNTTDWPDAAFYGYDQIYDARNLGYRGAEYSFSSIPDQYTLSEFHRRELARSNHQPVMAEVDLLSSHAPFEPVPQLVNWNDVGDGSIFGAAAGAGDAPSSTLHREGSRVRADYARSIEYSLNALVSYVEAYGGDSLVLVFLGDHQPTPVVTGGGASRDVPITIVARDQTVMDRVAGWGWQDGFRPGPQAPVWRMDTFRDRFLTAFGP